MISHYAKRIFSILIILHITMLYVASYYHTRNFLSQGIIKSKEYMVNNVILSIQVLSIPDIPS